MIALETYLYSGVVIIKRQTEVNDVEEYSIDKNDTYIYTKQEQVQFSRKICEIASLVQA